MNPLIRLCMLYKLHYKGRLINCSGVSNQPQLSRKFFENPWEKTW